MGSLEMRRTMASTQEDAYEVQMDTALLLSSLGKHTTQQVLSLCNSLEMVQKAKFVQLAFQYFQANKCWS